MWLESFRWLFERHGAEPRIANILPPTFDELMHIGNGIAGSPQTVCNFIASEREAAGINYFVSWLAFGDLSLELFRSEVMPASADRQTEAAK